MALLGLQYSRTFALAYSKLSDPGVVNTNLIYSISHILHITERVGTEFQIRLKIYSSCIYS